ncbi:MAG TPA: CarD family transcriptional regulator, partial [Anaerolineales bacterium]
MLDSIRALPSYQRLLDDLHKPLALPGLALPRAARLPVLAALQGDLNRPVLLITDRSDHALTMLDELGFWEPKSARFLFPAPTPLFYEQAGWGNATRRDRLQVLASLAMYQVPGWPRPETAPVIVTPVRALMSRTLPRRDFIRYSKMLKAGQSVPPETLLRGWVETGYQPVDIVLEPGQFSRRGGILDVWPPAEPFPARLDFFGDEIDSIRRFDPASQRTIKNLDTLLVTPAREVLLSKLEGMELPGQDMEEFYLPLAHTNPSSLLDYLPQGAVVLVDDLDALQVAANEIEEQAVKLRRDSIAEGVLPADFPLPYLTFSEIQDSLESHHALELGRSTSEEVSELASCFEPGPRFGGRLKHLIDYLVERCPQAERIVIVSRQVSRLKELWYERRVDCTQVPDFIEGSLSEGWILSLPGGQQLHLLTDSEIFGWERPQPRQRHRPAAEAPESSYADFKSGDWVVHIDYGIGRYVGLVQRRLEGSTREFLVVEYEGGDQVFVPVYQADRLSRYIGPDGEPPTPTRLGTQEWNNDKQRVKNAV